MTAHKKAKGTKRAKVPISTSDQNHDTWPDDEEDMDLSKVAERDAEEAYNKYANLLK